MIANEDAFPSAPPNGMMETDGPKGGTQNTPPAETSAGQEDQPVPAPVVFQCSSCKTIVGDSSTIANMDPVNRTMSIKRVADTVAVDPGLQTSSSDFDFGSTFNVFACRQCSQPLGQAYRTTSAKLDHLRDLYTFHSESLIFYQLFPDADLLAGGADNDEAPEHETKRAGGAREDLKPVEELPSSRSSSDLEVEILKLQKFCTFLYDRILKLEEEQCQLERLLNRPSKKNAGSHSSSHGHANSANKH